MDRLTKNFNGAFGLVKVKDNEQEIESPYRNTLQACFESWQRLGQYEDTGLTPEEIEATCAALKLAQARAADMEAEVERLRAAYEEPPTSLTLDDLIDRIVKPAYARRSAYVAKPDPSHRDYKIIAVDFDGCLCENAWPGIGEANHDLISRLKFRRAAGDKLILWTCREGKALDEAVEWCKERGMEFDAVNENLPEMTAMYGNDCRKIGADWYYDDKAMNVKA